MKSVIVSFEGVNLSHRYVVREMTLLFVEDDAVRHYFFNPPNLNLTPADKRTDGYTQTYLGGIGVNTEIPGALGADVYRHILTTLGNRYRVLCVGEIAAKLLTQILPYADIWELQSLAGLTYPKTLRNCYCGYNHQPRYCSLAKTWYIRNFMITTDIFMSD